MSAKLFNKEFVNDNSEVLKAIFNKYNILEVYMSFEDIITTISLKFADDGYEPIYKVEKDIIVLCNGKNHVALFRIANLVLYGQFITPVYGSTRFL